uniref:Uncharacterized protein n=1 Tax=virus sp. ctoYX9 TaxID=2825822 RepID=A0A8S5RPB7_9VIRU|nr:MAG TPA: hypothetical protein [virus sp. ctoYX9]
MQSQKFVKKTAPPNCPKKQKWHLLESTICCNFAAPCKGTATRKTT